MTSGGRISLLSLMHGIAAGGLMLAAITSEASVRSLVGVIGVGLCLWLFDLWTFSVPVDEDDAVRGRGLVALSLGVLLFAEAAGLAINLTQSLPEASLYYGTAVLLQFAALATTARCGPDDMTLVAWAACHVTIAIWATITLVSTLALTLSGRGVQVPGAVDTILFWMTGLNFLFTACSFLLMMSALALSLLMEPARRRRVWTTLILTQAAVLLIFLRWRWENR